MSVPYIFANQSSPVPVSQIDGNFEYVSKSSNIAYTPAGTGAVDTTVQTKLRETVSVKDFGAVGDGIVDDRLTIIEAMNSATLQNKTLFVPDGVYLCSNWIPLPSKLKMVFAPNATWKLNANTSLGGFVCGGYDINLVPTSFDDVEIHGIALDCNNIAGENGFNAISGTNIRLFNPKIKNTLHSPTTLGGRAFQFEGGIIDGIDIYSPYLNNCSIGINSQGSPAGTYVARNINYYDVVMQDVDIPFNVDSQYASPETNTLLTMSTFVNGAELYNCGKITWPGDTSGGLGGGIVCGDRGYGLKISGLRVINSVAYGGIGALVRGKVFNISLNDVQMQASYCVALFDFNTTGFGFPSAGTFPCTVFADSVFYNGNLDYVIKGGSANNNIGMACFRKITIDSTLATITGVVDLNAGTGSAGSSASLELVLSDSNFKTSGLRSLENIYLAGNTIGVCQPDSAEGPWTPVDASGAALTFTVSGTSWYVRSGRLVTAICKLDYPVTANGSNATIGGLPFTAANLSSMAGTGAIGYTNVSTLARAYVVGNTNTALLSTSAGLAVTNANMSAGTILVTFSYLAA